VDFKKLGHGSDALKAADSRLDRLNRTRLWRTASQAPAAPQMAIITMPSMDQRSGTCENAIQPPSMAKPICA
jgi:hypothetical protein